MANWFEIKTPDWLCEARGAFCQTQAQWEEERTAEQIQKRILPELRCEAHLPSDANKVTEETEPQTEVA